MVRTSTTHSPSDADLITRIAIAFTTRPRIAWHDIQVSVHGGLVTLRGKVSTPYDRQLIVAVTRHVAGVVGIDDHLRVTETLKANPAVSSQNSPRNFNLGVQNLVRAGVAAFVLALVALTGCGGGELGRVPVHPTTGAIQFRGKPVVGAFVSLVPKQGASAEAPTPRATVGADGKFSLSTYDGQDGAPEGDYVLTVQWYKPIRQGDEIVGGPNVLPQKYASARTSDLLIKIAAGENQLQPIQIR